MQVRLELAAIEMPPRPLLVVIVQRTGKSAFRAAEVGVSAMLSVDAHALRLDVQIDVPDMPRRR